MADDPRPSKLGSCDHCEADAVVKANDRRGCVEHVDDTFRPIGEQLRVIANLARNPRSGYGGRMTEPAVAAPVRLCCGQRHSGAVCPDGKVMCCICFGRFEVADLHTFTGHDRPSDVCTECGAREEVSVRG